MLVMFVTFASDIHSIIGHLYASDKIL